MSKETDGSPTNVQVEVEKQAVSSDNSGPNENYPASGAVLFPPPVLTPVTTPFSIFTRKEKWLLVGMVGVAGLFSPLPANIYFPAIPTLAVVFDRAVEDLNLTVTVYLAMQGCSPMLWGPLSDRYGRRPLFLLCLLILIASSLGLALCPTSTFWLLLLLRAVQAGGCASTIALGSGVIGDIATGEERGGFFGMFNLGPMLAPCIGPAIGGALSESLGWRSIFWFLVIFSCACFAMILLFLPETMRTLVGNGSRRPDNLVYRPFIPIVGKQHVPLTNVAVVPSSEQGGRGRSSINPFRLLVHPDVILTLSYTGIVYAVNYTITSTISSSFAITYPYLSETELGVCYLSTGAGMMLGSTINGKLLDRDYARIKQKQQANASLSADEEDDESDAKFPIEYARLRMVPVLLMVFVGSVIGWGWCIQLKTSIAGPLVLQVIREFDHHSILDVWLFLRSSLVGYTSIAILNSTMTLMIDIIKDQSSGVIACTNLVRCALAAMLVALIDRSTVRLGYGWTYTLLGAICATLLAVIYAEVYWGPRWRRKRKETKFKR